MKKIIVLALAAVFTSAILMSCEKDDTRDYSSTHLKQDLSILNNNLYESAGISFVYIKGFWSSVGKVCAVAGADLTGAYAGAQVGGRIGAVVGVAAGNPAAGALIGGTAGAVVCGAGASYSAGQALKNNKNLEDPYPNGYINTLSSPYANNNNIGIMHNKYLDILFNGWKKQVRITLLQRNILHFNMHLTQRCIA